MLLLRRIGYFLRLKLKELAVVLLALIVWVDLGSATACVMIRFGLLKDVPVSGCIFLGGCIVLEAVLITGLIVCGLHYWIKSNWERACREIR